jgi:tRNA (adenine57-N1/adenine58-N1)-methyltransferase
MDRNIGEGSLILLHFDLRRQWLLRVVMGREFHTHKGYINLGELVGKPFGCEITSSTRDRFWALRPTTHDLIMHTARRTQIMYPKDIGLVLLKLSLTSGAKVLEIGTGSGAMTVAAAMAVRESGHVDTYEVRPEFVEMAEKNLKRAALSEYVTIHQADASKGIEDEGYDAAIIDVGDPWPIIPLVHGVLLGGAPVMSFSPTVNQVERTTESFAKVGFVNVHTLECFIREIRAETGKTRPATMMVGHTGYMTFAQKVLPSTGEPSVSTVN